VVGSYQHRNRELGDSMADVTVSAGMTVNLGNFESLRLDYGITDKVRNYEEPLDAIVRLEELVHKHLTDRVNEERESIGKGTRKS
jgi:hypothetical protein